MSTLTNVALVVSGIGTAYALYSATLFVWGARNLLPNFHRHRRRHSIGDALELKVDGETFTFNVGEIEQEDPRKLKRALEAVRAIKRSREDIAA